MGCHRAGFQMGGVLGLGLVVPVVAYRSRSKHGALIASELTPAVLAALAKSGIIFTGLAGEPLTMHSFQSSHTSADAHSP